MQYTNLFLTAVKKTCNYLEKEFHVVFRILVLVIYMYMEALTVL